MIELNIQQLGHEDLSLVRFEKNSLLIYEQNLFLSEAEKI